MKEKERKFVYIDDGNTKVVKGKILREDDFTYTIIESINHTEMTIGKRAIVQINEVQD